MNKFVFIAVVLIAIISVGWMFMQSKVEALEELQPTVLMFKQKEIDLGLLKFGKPQLGTFTFTNTGDTPLIINNVTTSCGCTTPEWPRQPIKPGKAGEIKVIYDAQYTGRFIKTVRVEGNIPGGFMELTIKGQVLAKASNEPDYTP